MYEIGAALFGIPHWRDQTRDDAITTCGERAVKLYQKWCDEAR